MIYNADKGDIAIANGALSMKPHGGALWFAAGAGPLVYKLVTGDFKVTATVHAHKASNVSLPPDLDIEVGGVMARAPTTNQSYVFLDIGYAEQHRLGVEHKSTVADVSTYDETISGNEAELRICRTGATMTLLRRDIGQTTWKTELTVARPDLPATLQVGADASTGQSTPDVEITFDAITFAPIGAGCAD
jgi:hypothetical protein